MSDKYLKQLQEASVFGKQSGKSYDKHWLVKLASKLNFERERCRKIKDDQQRKMCWNQLRLKQAIHGLELVKHRLSKCKDDACFKRN